MSRTIVVLVHCYFHHIIRARTVYIARYPHYIHLVFFRIVDPLMLLHFTSMGPFHNLHLPILI